MTFIDTRLLDCVSYGTQGGPTWSTRKVGLKSGIVKRNAQRSRVLYRYVLAYHNLRPDHYKEVIGAFNACRGGLYSFRLKDWSDYQAVNQYIGVGTGSSQSLQLAKLYEFGASNYSRAIRKPVSGTVSLTQNGSPLSATVDYATGIVTFTATASAVIRWSGEFDVPVMFSQDELMFSFDARVAGGFILTSDVTLEEDLSE